MPISEQMVERRSWKEDQGVIQNGRWWVYHGHDETVEHVVVV